MVLLTSFNGSEWIKEQINSILNQKGVDLSILISDDCSSDNTISIIESICNKDQRVSLIKKDYPSGSAAKNFYYLFRTAKLDAYDFVAYSDQDDIWHPNKMYKAINKIKNNLVFGYSCSSISFWPNGSKKLLKQSNKITKSDFLFESAGQGCTYVLPIKSFKKIQDFCKKNSDLDLLFHHDWLSYLLVRSWQESWYFDKRSWINYRQHNSNEIGSRGSIVSINKRLKLIKNGWYKRQILLSLDIYLSQDSENKTINYFNHIFKNTAGLKRKFLLTIFFIRNGRRKFFENTVLIASVIRGWI